MSHKCCVVDCEELVKETRSKGLPLHKFPKDPLLRTKWLTSGGFLQDFKPTNSQIVCYKHFKQHDYEIGRSHKLFLKKGSVPSVFANYQQHPDPITPESNLIVSRLQAKLSAATVHSQTQAQTQTHPQPLPSSDLPDVSSVGNFDSSCSSFDASMDSSCSLLNGPSVNKPTDLQLPLTPVPPDIFPQSIDTPVTSPQSGPTEQAPPTLAHVSTTAAMKTKTSASQVSSSQIQQQTDNSTTLKKTLSGDSKLRTYNRTDLTFLPGSRLEAKDFNEKWYSARVVETDWGEREVLIHFDKWSSRFDEWIPMDSSRLRTLQLHSKETKSKEFAPGERILATWVDGKKYPAKVSASLGSEKYDVLFDDGYSKVLKVSKMTKLLEIPPGKREEENTYLGSKQERRDKKRKHNVTELFQHKKKSKTEPDKAHKKQDSIDSRNVKHLSKAEPGPLVKTETLPKLDNHQNITNSDEDYTTFIGNLRVEIEDSTYKCPKIGCNKNFRKENLLQMHIKHYHPEYSKYLGSTPNVADLAYARTTGESIEDCLPKKTKPANQSVTGGHGIALPVAQVSDAEFVDLNNKLENKFSAESNASTIEDNCSEISNSCTMSPGRLFDIRSKEENIHTGIKTLPPIRQPAIFGTDSHEDFSNVLNDNRKSTNVNDNGKTHKKKQLQYFADTYGKIKKSKGISENDESFDQYDDSLLDGDDISDYKCHNTSNGRVESEHEIIHNKKGEIMIINGEIIKVEKLKREEIINCTCGITEEDGLMIQCDLCLCWQHGHCNSIEKEKDVPEKYVCYICQHSHRQRNTRRYFHDQDWIKEGKLLSIHNYSRNNEKVKERTATLKRSCDLIANLLQIQDLLHSLRVKVNVAQNKDHQKLYLWAKNWSKVPVPRLIMEPIPIMEVVENEIPCNIEDKEKENLETDFSTKGTDQKLITSDTELMQILEEDNSQAEDLKLVRKNFNQNNSKDEGHILLDALTKNVIDGQDHQWPSIKYEISNGNSTSKQNSITQHISLEKMHKITSVHTGNKTPTNSQPVVPEPEAPIDPVECKLRLLEHIDNFQNYLDSILNYVETQLSALEKVTGKYNNNHVQTKQTMQMLLHDLESIRKLAALC